MSVSSPTSTINASPSIGSSEEGSAAVASPRSEGATTSRLGSHRTAAPARHLPVLPTEPQGTACSHAAPVGKHATRWDAWGAIASGLCVVHCVVFPLILPALAMAGWNQAGWDCCQEGSLVHLALFFLVVPIGAVALISGYRRHRRWTALAVGGAGVILLTLALLLGSQSYGILSERTLTILGSFTLISAHLLNQRRCRCC